jgi:hypothetical protein
VKEETRAWDLVKSWTGLGLCEVSQAMEKSLNFSLSGKENHRKAYSRTMRGSKLDFLNLSMVLLWKLDCEGTKCGHRKTTAGVKAKKIMIA